MHLALDYHLQGGSKGAHLYSWLSYKSAPRSVTGRLSDSRLTEPDENVSRPTVVGSVPLISVSGLTGQNLLYANSFPSNTTCRSLLRPGSGNRQGSLYSEVSPTRISRCAAVSVARICVPSRGSRVIQFCKSSSDARRRRQH